MTVLTPDPSRTLLAIGDSHHNVEGVTGTFRRGANTRAAKFQARALEVARAATIHIGDITEEGRSEEAAIAEAWWAAFPDPKLIVPGNHDIESGFDAIADWITRYGPVVQSFDTEHFRVVGCLWSSHDAVLGLNNDTGQAAVAAELGGTDLPTALVFHYPPRDTVPNTATPYNAALSAGAMTNLGELIGAYPNLKLVLSGHTHTEPWFAFAPFAGIAGTNGRKAIHQNVSATTYVANLGNTKSPLVGYCFSFYDDYLEVRLRNMGAGSWVPRANGWPRVERWDYF